MGSVGDAYDNAMAESFFASLECELFDRRSWTSFAEARALADDSHITVDREVAQSEADTGFRNANQANFIRSFGNLKHPVGDVLETYFNQCALRMNCVQLAGAGLSLANAGIGALTGHRLVDPQAARRIHALMMTCGHCDASGDFAFRVGLPGKSGVGGGILAIAPRRASVAVNPSPQAAGRTAVTLSVIRSTRLPAAGHPSAARRQSCRAAAPAVPACGAQACRWLPTAQPG